MNNWEEWKPIPGYEGLYEVSNLGNVRSLRGWNGRKYIERTRLLKKTMTTTGYYKVELIKEKKKKSLRVHRLVAMAFIPNENGKPYINHIDCNPLNNKVENLEWCTQKENVHHALRLDRIHNYFGEAERFKELYCEKKCSLQEIAEMYGISITTVRRVLDRHGVKRRSLSEAADKHGINLKVLYEEFRQGKTNKELAKKYSCSPNLIAVRRYQMKRKGA